MQVGDEVLSVGGASCPNYSQSCPRPGTDRPRPGTERGRNPVQRLAPGTNPLNRLDQVGDEVLSVGGTPVKGLRLDALFKVAAISRVDKYGPFRCMVRSNQGRDTGRVTRRAVDFWIH